MADLSSLLAVLETDPDDAQALGRVAAAVRAEAAEVRTKRLAAARSVLSQRGRPDIVLQLLDIELAVTSDPERQVELLREKGLLLEEELLDVPGARVAFQQVLALRPSDAIAREALEELELAAQNWQKFAAKYVAEASASTDRSLATALYVSAAEAHVRFAPHGSDAEAYLLKALEIDPTSPKAAFHLARLYRREQRWHELARLYDRRADVAATLEERVAALMALADLARTQLQAPDLADAAVRRVLVLDPAQPQALRTVTDALVTAQNWRALVATYQAALKARREEDLGILLQIAMVLWRHLGELDHAEEYFRRVRRLEPAHPAALDFYRAYYPARGEHQKLLAMLRQVEKQVRPRSESGPHGGGSGIGIEIAALAEAQNNPEKAIEAWKQHLRQDPSSTEARVALARLYRRTEKWNALLDLMKDDIERLPEGDVAGRVERLHQIVQIYRDKLRLDVMVINTYNAILKIDPDNQRASDELAAKFRTLGRWNDLIAVLTRRAEAAGVPDEVRVAVLREIADLWSERFGNFANAVRPLERIVEIAPRSELARDASTKLKEIYTKRRQWRPLIDLLGREANELPPAEKRAKQSEMARLAAERLGDSRLAIEILNHMLSEGRSTDPAAADHPDTLAALAGLYERERRYLALAEILDRQIAAVLADASAPASTRDAIAMLEKLAQVYADRLGAPQVAAQQWQRVLDLAPNHPKALRTLRELYATAGDFGGLEQLYARLGQQEELVDALLGIADRLDAKAQRLPLVVRAAQLAQHRADAEGAGPQAVERARQVWERVLAIDPTHTGAASALAPIYANQEKWARLITVLELELAAATEPAARLAKIDQIRELCEQRLSSRTLAFTWTLRAFELDPASDRLFADVLRLASEPEQWRDVAALFDRQLTPTSQLDSAGRLKLLRELATITLRRLGDLERARSYCRQVLAFAPDDREAERRLEELSGQLADWPEVLASYRRRAAREQDRTQRVPLLLQIASVQEERLVDLDGAAATYREVLEIDPEHVRALRALARIEEARGDVESLARVLALELGQTSEAGARFELLMRLGQLEEQSLERPARALAYYREALAIPPAGGGVRPQALAAIVRFLPHDGPGGQLAAGERVAAARLVLPHLEVTAERHGWLVPRAIALEVIRAGEDTSPVERLEIDRALMRLYRVEIGDPAAAWQTGLRVLAAEPSDRALRGTLDLLASQLGRDSEWAQQLAGALATLRGKQAPPADLRAIATELAQVATERLGDQATAERAWLEVLEHEADAPDAFDALAQAYRSQQRWTDLRALLERRVEVATSEGVRLAALLEVAALEDGVLGQPDRAMDAYRRVLELDPAHAGSYQALDRLYTTADRWQELEQLLARRLDQLLAAGAVASDEQDELRYRRAVLFAERLEQWSRAVDLLEDVVRRDPDHGRARELLETLMPVPEVHQRVARLLAEIYEADQLWDDLVDVLEAQRELATGTEAVELLARIAGIQDAELHAEARAFDAWIEVLRLDPTHERARVELARLAQRLQRWPEATAALEAAASAAAEDDLVTRAALLGELAAYYDLQLGDSTRAITAYGRWLEADPSNPTTVRRTTVALARLYEAASRWAELRGVLRKQADWAEAIDERRALLSRIAALDEDQLQDRSAAIASWREVLGEQPTDAGALAALERLYQATEQWRELIDILQRMLDQADLAEAKRLLGRIAELHEIMLEEPDEAIAAHLEVLDRDPSDARALGELARLYREAGRHADLLDIVERQAQLEPAARLPHDIEIARLLAGPLGRPIEALERWRVVVEQDPEHAEAIAAIEAALDEVDLRLLAADLLRPVYDGTGQHERLAQLQLRAAEWADEPAAKLRALAEVARLREFQLDDKPGAFATQLVALRHAATEPELADVVAEVERLAGELGREADLIEPYREVAPNVLDSEIQRRLYLDVADLSRAVRHDLTLAGDYYQRVLDGQPDDQRALAALESIYRETRNDERLAEMLLREAEIASAGIDDRVSALVEAAGLYAGLGRHDEAIATWEQVLVIAPERRDAVGALEALYREQGRWPDVVDLFERRLGFATSIDEAVVLRVQLGEINERHLHDIEAAIESYAAALSGDPRNAQALAALERFLLDPELRPQAAEVLEPIYVAQHRWLDLIRVHEAKLDSAVDPAERLRITRFVARLYEEQLEDFERASQWYARLFREQPGDAAIRDQLQRLASMFDSWGFVAQTYQQFLDDEQGESDEVRDIAIAAAAIYDRRLGDVDAAYAAYRRALAITIDDAIPNDRELVRRLEEMLARTQKWPELVATYEEVIARGDDDDLRREVLIKRARLVEDELGDVARAIEGWREVVLATEDGGSPVIEHAYREAVAELERLYRQGGAWRELVDLLEAQLTRAQHPLEIGELRLRLAQVLEVELEEPAAAIDQHEHLIAEGPLWKHAVGALERLVVHEAHRERVVELLEPVYREQDWWQKLVVILDAKLEYVRDPLDQIAVLHEIAALHEDRGGALELALAALARAWRLDVADDESLEKLLVLAGRLQAWDDVVATLEEGAATAQSPELAAGLWTRVAELHEAQRGDAAMAIRAWRKVDEAQPDDLVALGALDRLLAVHGTPAELVAIVERRAAQSEDDRERLALLHRVAALHDEVLRDRAAAITAYRNVLSADDADTRALDALERLYRDANDPRELVSILERKIELSVEPAVRQGLRHAAARVYEQQLDDVYQAIGHLTAILDDDATAQAALAELDRVYTRQKLWPELLDIIDRRAQLVPGPQERAELAFRAARLVEVELADPDAAIPRHEAVLQLLPAHAGARAALEALLVRDEHVASTSSILERIYRADRDPAGLVRVYERRLAAPADDPAVRRADFTALAEVHETLANQPAQAFAVWSRALQATPEDADLLAPLTRLAGGHGLWAELADRLERVLEESLPPDVEQAYAMRLGQIAEDQLRQLERAAGAFERASQGPEPRAALSALERVLARASRWSELVVVLRRQADAAEGEAQAADYLFRVGDLLETTLRDDLAAVGAYREVLALAPAHTRARAALERMLHEVPDQRPEIVDILEPLFEQDGDAARLIGVLEARLQITDDPMDRASLLARIAELAEQRLGDRGRALDAALRWLAIEPASGQALAETERLAERLGQWREVGARVHAIIHAPDAARRDADVQVALLTFLGRIHRDRLGKLEAATEAYRAALALEPEALTALDALIAIMRQRGDQAGLVDALRQRGRIVSELPEKRAAYAEVAQLCERAGDRAGALVAWREITDLDETDRGALDELARLHRLAGDTPALIEVLGRAARIASSAGDEKLLRVEIARLEADGPRAASAWKAVLDLDPDDVNALGALERAYARAGDWIAVSDIQMRRLSLAQSSGDKVAIHAEVARTAEAKRGSIDEAIASWYAALDLDASYQPAYAELDRLLTQAGRSHDLVELLEKRAELLGALGDGPGEIAALARAADVWEAQLDDPDAAGEILQKILTRDPSSVAALTRLSKIYERAGDWGKCKATLEQALRLSPSGRDAADLFFRLGEVARAGDHDPATAILHFQQALKHDAGHTGVIAALEQLARDRRDGTLLAEMLQRRAGMVVAPEDRVMILVELAELERKAGRIDAALAALADAARAAPADVRVLAPLADLYFAANRLEEAAPIYDQLAADAKAARRMKDVARFRQRQGGILEARGDHRAALTAYEEALRVNPTDISTMTGLGRLYLASEDWEKARKIYQSLVLQNIDADAGVTKGEVYWALGKIHLQLGQPPKAKSMFQRGLELEPQNQKLKDALSSLA